MSAAAKGIVSIIEKLITPAVKKDWVGQQINKAKQQ